MTSSLRDYLEFATPRQTEFIEAIEAKGSHTKAAKYLGISRQTIDQAMQRLRDRAALRGHAPEHGMHRTVPATHFVKGVSTLDHKEKGQLLTWTKTAVDEQYRVNLIIESVEAIARELPKLPPVKAPKLKNDMLCNVFTLTDCHLGMKAWAEEGGSDWDMEIAEATIFSAFKHLLDSAPDAHTAILAQLGDFLHFDGLLPVTPKSKHILDADGRYSQLFQLALRLLRRIMSELLKKYNHVVLVMAEGNHDEATSVALRILFKCLFENEPRVEVVDSELPYYVYQHGEVMLAWHHSHIKQMAQLPLYFAAEHPVMWGETKRRYCHTGDKHHSHEKEFSGMTVVQHPTLAARDAYTSRHGWHADRRAMCITYHQKLGETQRISVVPEMFT